MLADSEQRRQATDPERSFIVQAPAGSGKTELLTQRFLRLLSRVTAPEQIIALTFTRKAASEMHERIILALKQASTSIMPSSQHQQATDNFAKAALDNSKKFDWQILEQPSRLKIMTIDALCHYLTKAIPLYEQQIPYADIAEQPSIHYQSAAKACIRYGLENSSLSADITTILEHLDNRQDKLEDLFCDLLASRQQWLEPLFIAKDQLKTHYEQALQKIESHHIERLYEHIPIHCREELQVLASHVAAFDLEQKYSHSQLKFWHDFRYFDRSIATALASLLLTTTGDLRKSFDHNVGLQRSSCDKNLYDSLKARSKVLLQELAKYKDLVHELRLIKILPEPIYAEDQWQVLQSLLALLPILAAHLHLEFRKNSEVDFTSIADQALLALGKDDEPTDLTLYLDSTIHHLLVDEFQDTSIGQYQLLAKLTAGWLNDEAKTLFLVGDPQQSIYRFRQAEVGLFLKVQQQGLGNLKLTPLHLSSNFRSTPTIIHWINQHFVNIFPKNSDIEAGAVSFHPSIAGREDDQETGIFANVYSDKRTEALAIVNLVKELSQDKDKTIAILVRSRQQLSEIIPELRKAGLAFKGTEIEKLGELSHVKDLWSLIKALLLPADRLSWLAFLRSPWCGLSLADIHALANFDSKKSIFYALSKASEINLLSIDGLQRCNYIYQLMHQTLDNRQQQSLLETIEDLMQNLHAKHILKEDERKDISQLFKLISQATLEGGSLDIAEVEKQIDSCHSSLISPSNLEIMTIHKSKGLEFDTVILPGLGSKMSNQDRPLLRWIKLLASDGSETILLSPINASDNPNCSLYNYLGSIDKEKERFEQQRLFYVATTRAKRKLYLFDYHENPANYSFRDLLAKYEFSTLKLESLDKSSEKSLSLSRLALSFYQQPFAAKISTNRRSMSIPANPNARIIGIVAHELLEWICKAHPTTLASMPWDIVDSRFQEHGLSKANCNQALTLLKEQIAALFADPIGKWICEPHEDEKSEYALIINEDSKSSTIIIDRTFCEGEIRWIIDFKTGMETEDAQDSHYKQVNEYARILALRETKTIKCGLFYLSTGHWQEWTYNIKECKEVKNLITAS